MSIIESSLQKQKEYDGRKQDHGDAASQKGHFKDKYEATFDHRAAEKKLDEHLRLSLDEATDLYKQVTPEELEAAADAILDEFYDDGFPVEGIDAGDYFGYDDDAEDAVDINQDGFLTEADLGLRSKHEIAKLMAQRATLDPDFDRYDDMGDSDYDSHIRIRTRL